MSRKKKEPIRTCIGCRESCEKKKLTRIVRTAEGIKIDPTGKLAGRGAYLCDSKECLKSVLKNNRLSKALKTNISDDILKEIEGYLNKTE
ncbi:MAG: YlxR family protein [Armatimonadota bacterium]